MRARLPRMPGSTPASPPIELEYETFGNKADPPIVLVIGFSEQLISWDVRFCEALAGRGFFVVRFDNRDVGLSTKIDGAPRPDIGAILGGDRATLAYGLEDMADDVAGLIDVLALGSVNLVGVSMGGMISQTLAIRHPSLVRSLVSIMSTTGDPRVGHALPETFALVMKRSPAERAAYIEHATKIWHVLRSPGFAHDEAAGRERIGFAYDRQFHPEGVARQAAAIAAQADRSMALLDLHIPATVIHGVEDTLIGVSGGEATAAAIPGAKLITIPGMGHDLPEGVWPTVIDAIVATARAEAERD